MIGREHGGNDVSDYILIALLTVVGCAFPVYYARGLLCFALLCSVLRCAALHCSLSTISDRPSERPTQRASERQTERRRDRQACRLLVCCNSDFVLLAASGSSFVLLRVCVVSLSSRSLPLPLPLPLLPGVATASAHVLVFSFRW